MKILKASTISSTQFFQALTLACLIATTSTPVLAQYEDVWAQDRLRQESTRQQWQQRDMQNASPQAMQMQRWENEWKQQHPGEPVPNMGRLQKMHMNEINANINQAWNSGRQLRQAKLQENYNFAKQIQEQKNAAQHIHWTSAQWAAWNRQYELSGKAQADAYLEGRRQAAEIGDMRRRNQDLGIEPREYQR